MANNQKKYASLSTLQTFLDNIKTRFTQIGHKHTLSDLTDYKVDTTLSSTSSNPIANKTVNAEFDAIGDALGALELAIDGKADDGHNHDSRYYTESEIDTKLSSKSDTTHKHDSIYAAKNHDHVGVYAPVSHDHDSKYDLKGSSATVQTNLNTVSDTLNSHTSNADIHFTATERTKLSGIAAGAQVNTITGVKGNSESSYRTGNVNITKANIGLGNVDNTSDANKSVKHATTADSATSATKTTQDGSGNVITSTYETKTDASAKLAESKSYTDTKTANLASASTVDAKISTHNTSTTAHNDIRALIDGLTTRLNTLANSDDTTLDQMSEVVAYIKNNKTLIDGVTTNKVNVSDIINNLTTNVTNKPLSAAQGVAIKSLIDALQSELDSHTHAIADVSGLQTALDGKAASSHGTHVSYSTTAPVMDGTASVGTASTVARSDHKHPTDTSRASQVDLDALESVVAGKANITHNHAISDITNLQVTLDSKTNQNAFSNIAVSGQTTVIADTVTDTVTFVGSNVSITTDATNDKVTFTVADGTTSAKGVVQLTDSTASTSTTTAATPKNVKAAYDLANTAKTTADSKADKTHTHKVSDISDLTATATELNYMDGVTSNVQLQLDTLQANIDAIPQSDWNQNDSTQSDYVKNRTHYSTFESTTLIEDTVDCTSGTSNFSGYFNIEIGNRYTVVFDETTYECVGFDDGGFKTIGAPYQSYSNYPFCIYNESNKLRIDVQNKTTHTVKIIGEIETVHKIDEKYIPDVFLKSTNVIGRAGEGKGAEIFNDYNNNIASGASSHAEGYCTEATGKYSHTEGYMTKAQEQYAHAEGYSNTASGEAAHAEGYGTWADGDDAHTEGRYTTAAGSHAHAEGFYTSAASSSQHVQGKYNIIDEAGTYAHIVGNGTSNTKRSNAHTIDWNGNAWFKGNVYIGGTSQTSGATLLSTAKTLTTAEYTTLERNGEINANTLYMLTDSEDDGDDVGELITVEDIDTICGASI